MGWVNTRKKPRYAPQVAYTQPWLAFVEAFQQDTGFAHRLGRHMATPLTNGLGGHLHTLTYRETFTCRGITWVESISLNTMPSGGSDMGSRKEEVTSEYTGHQGEEQEVY
ncbi:hypothetical protein E2C01_027260 [Portunus trituberculatus]|uniref:Uncharacterized protein n=1 Tax=Portunus trituberculatus TaxID=210409 RepID=A0A5B7EIA0_PORTR|nr:hypothetical protein [Portunus trituberculatus]